MSHHVYRHFDADNVLLYVGVSSIGFQRTLLHGRSGWFGDVATITIKHYDTREGARRAECLALQTESPRYNITRSKTLPAVQYEIPERGFGGEKVRNSSKERR